jgi:hypothetical protein
MIPHHLQTIVAGGNMTVGDYLLLTIFFVIVFVLMALVAIRDTTPSKPSPGRSRHARAPRGSGDFASRCRAARLRLLPHECDFAAPRPCAPACFSPAWREALGGGEEVAAGTALLGTARPRVAQSPDTAGAGVAGAAAEGALRLGDASADEVKTVMEGAFGRPVARKTLEQGAKP